MVEFWKRKNAELTHFFDCDDYQDDIEHPRVSFSRHAPLIRRNVITGQLEPYMPTGILLLRRATSWVASISFVMLIFLVTFGVITIRTYFKAELIRKYGMDPPYYSAAGPISTSFNLLTILILDYIYNIIARKLTNWEMYRTQREHEESLAWKAYWFQFVNVFAPMFYLAFVKGRFLGWPGHYVRVADMMLEACDIGGCFSELGMQLVIIMCGKQIVGSIAEYLVPVTQRISRSRSKNLQSDTELKTTFLNQEYILLPYVGLTGEYMETVIQFGFIVLFGAAFPLGALVSLLSNILEIRIDAQKLVVNCRRPLAQRTRSIGIWLHVLSWMTILSVWVNVSQKTDFEDYRTRVSLQFTGQMNREADMSILIKALATRAFLIAFTSDTLAELLFAYENGGTLYGYINHSLAISPIGTSEEPCRYEAFRNGIGENNKFYYELTVLRLTFVLCYVATVYGICAVIAYMIPDIPQHVLDARNRRHFLATQALQTTPTAAREAHRKVRTSTQHNPLAFNIKRKRKIKKPP